MTHEEMCHLWRFAPSGDPIFRMEPTDADLDAGQDADQDATELVDELALQPMPPK